MNKKTFYNFGIILFLTAIFIFAAPQTKVSAQSNNDFSHAELLVLNGNVALAAGDIRFADSEPGEPLHAELPGGKSVWYKFTPQTTTVARIKVYNANFDSLLGVYTGESVANLQTVGFNFRCGANCDGGRSRVDLMLEAGQTYYIAVAVLELTGSNTTFDISLTISDVAANDGFAGAHDLGSFENGGIAGTNFGAAIENAEPANGYSPAGKSVWYRWTALRDVSVAFNVDADFGSNIAVYSANVADPLPAQLNLQSLNADIFSGGGRYSVKFKAIAGKTYYLKIDGRNSAGGAPTAGNFQLRYGLNRFSYATRFSAQIERASLALYRPAENAWYTNLNFNGSTQTKFFGAAGDTPLAADYSGDGATDYAIVRNENGRKIWYVLNPSGTFYTVDWGFANDRAAVGDFDRDGIADMVSIRQTASGLVWYVRRSSDLSMRAFHFGLNFDKPVFGDFDGDGATDIAVTRTTSNGLVWYILKSGGAGLTYTQYTSLQFGVNTDLRAAEDYDGDGKTDVAVFRPETGMWYVLRSSDNQVRIVHFGLAGDIPQPGDYNADGKAETAVFRPADGTWYIARPTGVPAQNFDAIRWGANGDAPASSNGNPQ